MDDRHYSNIIHSAQDNTLTIDFKNTTEILIAESVGSIPKEYSTELKRLTAYTTYPPLSTKQLRQLAIENITSNEVKHHMTEKVYKEIEFVFEKKMTDWNSIVQLTAKRYVTNAVEKAVAVMREKLLENIDHEQGTSAFIVQRLVLVDDQLKIVSSFF